MQLVCRVDFDLIDKLKSINPSLVTRDTVTGAIKFRHGALGRYVQRLISEDIEKREKLMQDDVLGKFMP
ncbi:MAG: hypothetical protein KAJ19_25550 [Gammaproteobacteria bacterium]|nr:hypothetical protein [Gammaproteobacteria bacterium]